MVAFDTITKATGAASTATTFDTITRAVGAVTVQPPLGVSLGPDVDQIEPYTIVPLTATLTNGVGATLLLEQIGGAQAGISGTGPNWTYQAPATLAEEGAHLIFRVTATLGAQVESVEVDHFVYPNTFGYYTTAGDMVPARVSDNTDALPAPFPDSGVFPDTGVLLRS